MLDPLRWLMEQENFTLAFVGILGLAAGIYLLVAVIVVLLVSLIAR